MNTHPRRAVEQGFEQDRLDYWAMRDELLAKYSGKWVAVHKGRVTAVGDDPLTIMEQALGEDGYAYTNKVGDEDKIVVRQHRVSFPYDDTYSPTPIPRVTAVLHNFPQTKNKRVADAIPDTGADVTCLPVSDCQDLDLFLFPYYSGVSHPFSGGGAPSHSTAQKWRSMGTSTPPLLNRSQNASGWLGARFSIR